MCPFSKEQGKKVGHSEAPKRPRFPGCPLRRFQPGFQPSGSYPQATDKSFFFLSQAQHESGKQNEPKPKLLVRISSGRVGLQNVKGWGLKSSVCPSKPGNQTFWAGYPGIFAGMSRGCPKSLRTKSLCSIFCP